MVASVTQETWAQTPDAARNQIHSKGGLVSGLAAKLEAAQKQIEALNAQTADKSKQLEALQKSTQSELAKLPKLEAENASRAQALLSLAEKLKQTEARLETSQQELAQAKAQMEGQSATKAQLDDLNTKLQEQDQLIIELRSRLDQTANELGDKEGKIGDLAKNLGSHGSTIEELKAERDEAVYKTRELDAEIARLKAEVTEAKSSHHENQKSIEDLEFHRLVLAGLLVLSLIGLFYGLRRRR